jgi:hypothetical protein
MTTYLLDANIFIQAKNLHYGFDFCPAFWDWIDEAHAAATVCSIDSVRTELLAGTDELATWANERPSGFFLSPSASTVPSLQATSAWATTAGYEPGAVSIFLQADVGQHCVDRSAPGAPRPLSSRSASPSAISRAVSSWPGSYHR